MSILKDRYNLAHKQWFQLQYPTAFKDGFHSPPPMPVLSKANGLTKFIVNFLNWSGHRATRINVSGRQIKGKWIPSSTRKGTADIGSTININGIGRSVMWEIKIGKDVASEFQLKEKQREEMAGGLYFFVKTVDDFLEKYDALFVNL